MSYDGEALQMIVYAKNWFVWSTPDGQDDLYLTNNDDWRTSSLIARNASSYRVGADCGNGTLTLYVDGQEIASVSDTSYTKGGVGVFTWSADPATSTDVSFDDFLLTSLE